MRKLEHGGDIYTEGILKGRELLDFSSNINPLGIPKSFRNNIKEALINVERYPDVKYRELKKSLKEYIEFSKNYFVPKHKENIYLSDNEGQINEEDIVLGNGAAEIIDLVISCFNKICIPIPSFIEYEKNAVKWGCSIEYSLMKEDMTYNYKDILEKLRESEALVIANPNNPNGMVIDKERFKPILDYCEKNHKVVIIDEAFIEFTGKRGCSFLKELESYNCLFIIKALTKFYAMPGVRMGYGITKNKTLINKIEDKQNPWNINCFAEISAKYVLKDKEYIEKSIDWIEEQRTFMTSKLKEIDFIEKVYITYSNFILCKLKNIDCHKLYDICLQQGIVIRKCDNFKGLNEEYIRLAIKDRQSNEKFLSTLSVLNKF